MDALTPRDRELLRRRGLDEAKAAYAHAVEKRYRFLSYGDSCLFWL